MKRDRNKPIIFLYISFLLLFLSLFACKEPKEGCLDLEATNYDVSADDPCPDCCTYPSLKLEVLFIYDTLNMIYGNPYTIDNNSVINITKSKFYISDIRLENGTETLEIQDRIDLDLSSQSETVNFKNDFALISRDNPSFSYDIGEIRGTGTFDTLKFFVGLDPSANDVNPDNAPENHPLAIQADSMWSIDDDYFFHKLIVVPDTSQILDTKEFNIFGNDNLVEIILPLDEQVDLGFDVTLPLTVDYKLWFQGIDFAADTAEFIEDKIVNNTTQAFSITE